MDQPPTIDSAALAAGLHALTEVTVQLLETTAGYRQQALAHGFTQEAAEAMTVDFHRVLVTQILTPST